MLVAVPCQGADAVWLVDPDASEAVGSISTGGHPVHATVAAGRTFVATMDERAVTVIDEDGSVGSVSTGVLGPSHFALAEGRLFVACTGGDSVAVVDPTVPERIGRIHVGREPHGIAATGGRVYVGSRGDGSVAIVDAGSAAVVETVDLGTGVRVEDVEAVGRGAYAVDAGGERVVRVEEGIVASAPVGADPYGCTVREASVYVPGRGDGTVTVLDRSLDSRVVHEVGAAPAAVERIGGRFWVADRSNPALWTLDGDRIDLPAPSIDVIPLDEERALVAHYADAAVSVVDLDRGRVEATVDVGANPIGPIVV